MHEIVFQQTIVAIGSLQGFDLSLTQLTDAGMVALAGLRRLERLSLVYSTGFAGPQITDRGLVHLSRLSQLRSLNLIGAKITDECLELLVSLKRLETLSLTGTKISDDGVAQLRRALPDCSIQR